MERNETSGPIARNRHSLLGRGIRDLNDFGPKRSCLYGDLRRLNEWGDGGWFRPEREKNYHEQHSNRTAVEDRTDEHPSKPTEKRLAGNGLSWRAALDFLAKLTLELIDKTLDPGELAASTAAAMSSSSEEVK